MWPSSDHNNAINHNQPYTHTHAGKINLTFNHLYTNSIKHLQYRLTFYRTHWNFHAKQIPHKFSVA